MTPVGLDLVEAVDIPTGLLFVSGFNGSCAFMSTLVG